MIVEGIVTTVDDEGRAHVAPMGPRFEGPAMQRLVLRPFRTSTTYRHLAARREGVFHVTDDVELLARAAVERVEPPLRAARAVRGFIIEGACRTYEFRVAAIDDRSERVEIQADVVHEEKLRDFLGFNRAKHAVVEAAILATRLHLLPHAEVAAKMDSLAVLVEKTGGEAERRAFAFLRRRVEEARRGGGEAAAPPGAVVVRTGSRLHFGLLAPATGAPRRFGGAGVMVARPGLTLRAERAEGGARGGRPPGSGAAGPLAARALEYARLHTGETEPPFRLEVVEAPPLHAGLGAGTQLALAVARALDALTGSERDVQQAARRLGRARRSAIGVHGFARGGFLADGGRGAREDVAPLVARHPVPAEWRFVIAFPAGAPGLSGAAEEDAFGRLEAAPAGAADRLCRLLLLGLIPALLEGDGDAFGEALHEYGRAAGECFAAVQGGAFRDGKVAELVDFLRREGARGAGQSSWGPAVYAFAADEEEAGRLARRLEQRFPLAPGEVIIAPPLNEGASLELPPAPSTHTLA